MKAAVAALVFCGVSTALAASDGPRVDIGTRAKGADRVVVATVVEVHSSFERNAYGDQLIVSHALLQIEEAMKGTAAALLPIDVEGGTVGDLTLSVSDLPRINPGDRAVFFLDKSASGTYLPHLRGLGIL